MTEIEKLEQALEFMNTHRLCGLCTTPKTKNLESCTECECYIARSTILISLREKLDRLKNPPLTVEDLLQMGGKPVYLKSIIGEEHDTWELSQDAQDYIDTVETGCYIAYRYRPEDGEE